MSLARTILNHTAVHVIAKLAGNIIGVVVIALLTRYLGAEGFGHYTTIIAYLFFFASLADVGLYMITITELNKKVGKARDDFFSQIYSLRFFSASALMVCAGIVVWFLPYPEVVKQGTLITIFSIVLALMDQLHIAWYQSKVSMKRPAVADIVGKVVLFAGMWFGISMGYPLLSLLWVMVAAQFIHFLINLVGVRKLVNLKIRITPKAWKNILSITWPIALSQIFVLIYFKMDTVLLSLLRPADIAQIEVGLYGAPYKVLESLIAFVPLFMGLVAPQLSRVWEKKAYDEFAFIYQRAFDAFALVTLPLVVGGVVLASPIMKLVAPGFLHADTILQILMVAIGVIFFAHLPTYVINVIGEQKRMLPAYGFAAILALALYVVLIPIYSFYAAAWITVVIEAIILFLAWRRIGKVTSLHVSMQIFLKALLASVVMGTVLWYLKDDIHVVGSILIGGAVYGIIALALKAVPKDLMTKNQLT